MDKIEEYRTHAAHCLSLARKCSTRKEEQELKTMAEVWDTLADYREAAFEPKFEPKFVAVVGVDL